jgi:hypothetical protein
MEYTEEEKQIAQAIVGNKSYCELLAKVFLSTEVKLTSEVVREKTDKELGEIVRASSLAEDHIKVRWNKLKQLGQQETPKTTNKVPK